MGILWGHGGCLYEVWDPMEVFDDNTVALTTSAVPVLASNPLMEADVAQSLWVGNHSKLWVSLCPHYYIEYDGRGLS